MRFIKNQGLDNEIIHCSERGTVILGICGGLQMLGKTIRDPHSIESQEKEISGLGLLDLETTLSPDKITRQTKHITRNSPVFNEGLTVKGYEIHMGRTILKGKHAQLFANGAAPEAGLASIDGGVIATYLHGFLDDDEFRLNFLNHVRKRRGMPTETNTFNYAALRIEQLDKLAKIISDHIDIRRVYEFMNLEMVKV